MMNRSALKWTAYLAAGGMVIAFGIPAADFLINRGGDQYASYDSSHPEIAAAQAAAQNSINHFRSELENAEAKDEFTVDVRVFTARGSSEVVQLYGVRFFDLDYVSGRIGHDPYNSLRGGLKKGDYVEASVRDITDWSYRDGEKFRGNFSTRVLLKLQDEETRRVISAQLHEDPLP